MGAIQRQGQRPNNLKMKHFDNLNAITGVIPVSGPTYDC